jgi:hypothetical protein
MSLESNPIYQLGKDVIDGRKSLEEALNFAGSVFFVKRIDDKHFQEIIFFIDDLIGQHKLYDALSYLGVARRTYGSDKTLLLHVSTCDYFTAQIFNQLSRFRDALDLLEKNSIYLRQNEMTMDLVYCNFEIATSLLGLGFHNRAIELYSEVAQFFYKQKKFDYSQINEQIFSNKLSLIALLKNSKEETY